MKRTMTSDELINEIVLVLREGNVELLEEIATMVLVPLITYDGDGFFTWDIDDEYKQGE
jgi:hypothetical protein